MIAKLHLPRMQAVQRRPRAMQYCVKDDWTFDARYTQGRCPICGWAPERAPSAPAWMALVNRVDWEIAGLFLLLDVLFFLGLVVAHAAGLLPAWHGFGSPSSPGGGAASGARLH